MRWEMGLGRWQAAGPRRGFGIFTEFKLVLTPEQGANKSRDKLWGL